MNDVEITRASLISCLRVALPKTTPDGAPSVLDPKESLGLWAAATLPYNVRLADSAEPLAVVYPQTPGEIGAAVKCAKINNVPAIPRSGGHSCGACSPGGSSDSYRRTSSSSSKPRPYPPPITPNAPIPVEASLLIDMRAFRSINYDFHEQTVHVGAGTLLGEISTVLGKVGRMIPIESCPTVGVGGQAVSGGFGFMSRSQGLLLDNMLSAELVLANGQSITVSRARRPDLFWGIRGGGSSLGIAHSFVFRTHPAPETIVHYEISLLPRALPSTEEDVERAINLFMAFQEFGDKAPANLGMSWHVIPEPDGHGGFGTKVEVIGQWIGSEGEYEVVIRDFEKVLKANGVGDFQRGQQSLTYLQSMRRVRGDRTDSPEGEPFKINEHVDSYAKSLLTKEPLSRSAVNAHMTHVLFLAPGANPATGLDWFVLSPYLGGIHSAITKYSNTAFGHRDLMIVWELHAKKLNESAQDMNLVEFVRRMSSDLTPIQAVCMPITSVFRRGGALADDQDPPYVDPELTANEYPRLVWGDAYPRLQILKGQYDPSNVFRFPQSVRASQSVPWAAVWLVMVASVVLFWVIRHFQQRQQLGSKARIE